MFNNKIPLKYPLKLSLCVIFSALLLTPLFVNAQTFRDVGKMTEDTGTTAYGGPPKDVREIAANIIKGALSIIGILTVALMVYGGFLWMTARGDEQQVNKAKDTLRNAIIGLVIVVLSYAITTFVTETLLSAT